MNLDKFAQTEKQIEIMTLILKAADAGTHLSAHELHAQLSYRDACTVNAVLSSLKFLESHGLILRRKRKDGTRRHEILPTKLAYVYFRPAPIEGVSI